MAKSKERETMVKSMESKVSKENLEVAAYYLWLNRGCPENDDISDWVEAEKELGGAR